MSPRHRFRAYPAYRESGVAWLGAVPMHWDVRRLKHVAALNSNTLPEDTDPSFEMTYVDIGGVDALGHIAGQERLTFAAAPSRARRLVQDGDVIVSTVRTYLRAIAQIRHPEPGTVVSTGFAVVRPTDGLIADYAAYALRAPFFVERVVANSKGVSFPAINESEMATYELVLPPKAEQRAIAAFLDKETARIDELVARKGRLVKLLQERRTARITQAVTRGLDPAASMKDSGIEWLGRIPENWSVRRVKHVSHFVTSGSRGWAEHYADDGAVFLRIGNLMANSINLDLSDVQHVSPPPGAEGERTRVCPGDVLISITALIGAVGVVPNDIPTAFVNQHLALVRLRHPATRARWMAYCILSRIGQEQLHWNLYGGTKDGLGLEDIRSLALVLPPVLAQDELIRVLDEEGRQADKLVAEIRDAIERLLELRTALISAAVTGMIDVRGEVV